MKQGSEIAPPRRGARRVNKFLIKKFSELRELGASFENTGWRGLGQFKQNPSIPSFQHGVLEPRLTWMFPEHLCEPGCRPSMPA